MRDSRKNVTTRLTGLYPLQGKPEDKLKTLERIVEKLDSIVECNSGLIANLYKQVQELQSEVHKKSYESIHLRHEKRRVNAIEEWDCYDWKDESNYK